MTMMMAALRQWKAVLLSFLLVNDIVMAQLLPEPNVRWTHTLGAGTSIGRGLRKGNAVVAHAAGQLVFATADDGSLHIMQTQSIDGSITLENSIAFEPPAVEGKYTTCRSGVVSVEEDEEAEKPEYLVYAVIDKVEEVDSGTTSSRLLAVNLDGSLRWSLDVDGVIQGTPVVGQNGGAVYVVHNAVGATLPKGKLSVVLINDDAPTITASVSSWNPNAPFGPPSHAIGFDSNRGGEHDIIAIAESWGEGYLQQGSIHLLVPSTQFVNNGGVGAESYELRFASAYPFSAVARPALSADGASLWIAAQASNIAAWTGNRDLSDVLSGKQQNRNPRWNTWVEPGTLDVSQPLLTSPAVDVAQNFMYFPGTSSTLFCVQAQSGAQVWTDTKDGSAILAEPKLAVEDSVVYVIESITGNVRQHDVSSGNRNWEYSCKDITGSDSCQDGVEAEFSFAPTGNVLYYGDIFGRIVALEVASFDTTAPTAVPTSTPSSNPSASPSFSAMPSALPSSNPTYIEPTASPTSYPSGEPTFMPVSFNPSASPDQTVPTTGSPTGGDMPSVFDAREVNAAPDDSSKSSSSLLTIILGAGCGGLFVAAAVFFVFGRRRRKDEKKQGDIVIVQDVSFVDLEDPEEQSGDESSDEGDSMLAIEVVGGSTVYSPKKRKSKRKKRKPVTPSTPSTLESIEEVPEAFDESHPSDGTTVVLLGEDGDDYSDVGSQQGENKMGDNGSVQNLNDKFSYVVEVQTQPEISPPQSPDRSAPLSQGSVGTAKGGTHLELSVGNNQDLKPVPAQDAPPRRDLSYYSDSDFTESDAESQSDAESDKSSYNDEEEEKKAEDVVVRAPTGRPPKSPQSNPPLSPSSAVLRAPASSQLSPASSTDSDMYLDETKSEDATLSPLSPHIFGKSEAEDVPEDELRPPGAHLTLQPSLNHKFNSRSDDSTASDEFAAPGGHYMNGTPDTVPARSSKYGQSVRQKKQPGFQKAPSVRSRATPRGYSEWQTSDSSEDVRKPTAPTFKRRSKREDRIAKEATSAEDMPKDEWDAFMNDLEATEKQFYTPKASPSSTLLSYYDSDSDIEDIPPPPPQTRHQ